MMNRNFVRRLNTNAVVALLYIVEGSGMGNEHSVLQCVYVGNNREEIEQAIREDYSINGDIDDWIKSMWGKLRYYDNPSKVTVDNG
jgi:hypothetical protein